MPQQGAVLTALTSQAEAATLDQGPAGTTSTHSKDKVSSTQRNNILPKLPVGPGKGICAALALGSYTASREHHILSPSNGRTVECTASICVPLQPVLMQCRCSLRPLRHTSCYSKQITSFSALILSLSKTCCINFWSPLPLGKNQAQCDSQVFRAESQSSCSNLLPSPALSKTSHTSAYMI